MSSVELEKGTEVKERSREYGGKAGGNVSGGVHKTARYLSLLLMFYAYFVLLLFPFVAEFKVSRIRIDDISFTAELVREDIVTGLERTSGIQGIVDQIHARCEKSSWARDCRVSFSLPDTVKVTFNKVIPVALIIEDDGRVSIVSRDGEKIESGISISKISRLKEKVGLPFIILRSPRCSVRELADFLMYVEDRMPKFLDQVVCSEFSLEIYSTEKYKVILPLDDLYGAFDRFAKTRDQIINAVEVDARGKDEIFIR